MDWQATPWLGGSSQTPTAQPPGTSAIGARPRPDETFVAGDDQDRIIANDRGSDLRLVDVKCR